MDIIKTDSRFLHGDDLQRDGKWQEFTLTIKSVGERDSMRSEEKTIIPGWPVEFDETPKILVLNKINTRLAIAALKSNIRSEWTGKKLTVYPVIGSWFGQSDVYALRVRVPKGQPRPFIQPKMLGKDLTTKSLLMWFICWLFN